MSLGEQCYHRYDYDFFFYNIVDNVAQRCKVYLKKHKSDFRTLGNPALSFLDLDSVDFSKGQPVKTLDFTRKELSGNIKDKFTVQEACN